MAHKTYADIIKGIKNREMKPRGLSEEFLNAMRAKLDEGRRKGYVGWDTHWGEKGECYTSTQDEGSPRWFVKRIMDETFELFQAIQSGERKDVMSECADIANFAMMCVDAMPKNVEAGEV